MNFFKILTVTALSAVVSSTSISAFSSEKLAEPELCKSLEQLILAANRPTPFEALTEGSRTGDSISYMPCPMGLGMPEGRNCLVYIAGDLNGVRGGGQHNKVSCDTFKSYALDTQLPRDELIEKRKGLMRTIQTCSVLSDWTLLEDTKPTPFHAASMDVWSQPGTSTQVVTYSEEQKSRCRNRQGCGDRPRSQYVKFIVQALNPTWVDPNPQP